jgi:hydroxyacylglutathione hydrolase
MLNIAVKACGDNWVYIHPYQNDRCWVVDPSEASCVLDVLAKKGLRPTHLLATHHHADHIGGIAALKKTFGCTVLSAEPHRIAQTDMCVKDGDTLKLGDWTITVLGTPGHTSGSVCYYAMHPAAGSMLYSGDTLFCFGCGRPFECSAETLYQSLKRLSTLPDDTLVCPGHDYTEENIRFALTLEPNRTELKQWLQSTPSQPHFTPTTLAQEKQYNPFLRCDQETIRQAVNRQEPEAVFTELRRRKDHF